MNILLVGATTVGSSDGALLLAKALRRQNCTVTLFKAKDDLPFWARVGFSQRRVTDPIYQRVMNRALLREIRTTHPDVVFLYGSNWFVYPDTIRTIQRQYGGRVVLWELNQQIWRWYQAESMRLYDAVFALDSYLVPLLKATKVRNVFHLRACADPEDHFPVALSADDRDRYSADICFIGSAHPARIALLEALTTYNLAVYGRRWETAGSALAQCVRNEPVYGLKKTKVYAASRISINVHGPHMVHGENFRVYEVAACGSVSFSAHKPDLVSALTPDKEVVIFEDPADLLRKATYYLNNLQAWQDIATAGRERVLAEHTYDHRAAKILNCLNSCIPK